MESALTFCAYAIGFYFITMIGVTVGAAALVCIEFLRERYDD